VLVSGQGTNPRALAELLSTRLAETRGIARVEVAGPGFLNITVEAGGEDDCGAEAEADRRGEPA
jgi:arginyl-tRNA synthetase